MQWHLVNIAAGLLVFFLSSRAIYIFTVNLYAKRFLRRFELTVEELLYSYEEITYFVNIPSNNPHTLNARKEDLFLSMMYTSPFFPKLKGVNVYQRMGPHQKTLIAYLPVERYCIPLLRIFLFRGQMSKEAYRRIVACKLHQKQTESEIIEEVYTQMRRSNRFVS